MIKNYILWGKGFGLRWVFCALIVAIVGVFFWLSSALNQSPARQVFEAFPTLEIAQGHLVSPAQSYQKITVNPDFPVIIDTRSEAQIDLHFSNGLFLTTDTLFVKLGNNVQSIALRDVFTSDQQVQLSAAQIRQMVQLFFTFAFGVFAFFIVVVNYIVLLGATYVFLWMIGRKVPFKMCARCSALGTLVILAYIIVAITQGILLSGTFIIFVILGQSLLLGHYYRNIQDAQILNETLDELQNCTPKEAQKILGEQAPHLKPKKHIKTPAAKKAKRD